MENCETVIFDFDGTLVSKDTGYEFNKWLVQNSLLRTTLLILSIPFILPLICNSYTRKFGLNIGSFIATVLQTRSLFSLRSQFIHHYFNNAGAIPYTEGIRELQDHQIDGKSVAIISGCPRWLLYGVAKHMGIERTKIVGSELKIKFGALLLAKHCYGENKLKMAQASGLQPRCWIAGYSDSKADIPMLQKCFHKILVNVPNNKLKVFKRRLKEPIQTRVWI